VFAVEELTWLVNGIISIIVGEIAAKRKAKAA